MLTSSQLLELVLVTPATLWWLATLWAVSMTIRHIPVLTPSTGAQDDAASGDDAYPPITAIVPARDEADRAANAVEALREQEYPSIEVIAIDDRSTDDTGERFDELAASDAQITSLHVHELPDGWLGKVHAMQQGVERASGDWLLFADADVRMHPSTLRTAIEFARQRQLDLVTFVPRILSAGFVGDAAFNAVGAVFGPTTRLWEMPDPESEKIGAAGAFILVRSEAWARTPGFEWLRLEVADDFGIALAVKQSGGRCGVANGRDLIEIRWYDSFGEMARRMQKNFFAIVGRCTVRRLFAPALFCAYIALAPWLGLALGGPAAIAGALAIAAGVVATVLNARWMRRPIAPAFVPWIGVLCFVWLIARSGWIGWRVGGIVWRDTFYASETLRAGQRVRL